MKAQADAVALRLERSDITLLSTFMVGLVLCTCRPVPSRNGMAGGRPFFLARSSGVGEARP